MRSFAMKTLQIFAIGVVFSLAQLNAAPQFGRRQQDRGQDRVCFYKDIQYNGTEQCYRPGDEVTTLQNQRNTISSIRIYGRALVTVYDATNFNGHSMQFDSSAPDLGQVRLGDSRSWNDKIQSFRVESGYGYGNGRYGSTPYPNQTYPNQTYPSQTYPNQQSISDGICVYEEPNYQGRSECWSNGERLNDLGRLGNWSDRISSIRVFGRARAVAYRDIGFRGESLVIDRDMPDLGRVSANSFRNWRHQISSIDIESERGRGRGWGWGRR
jgi:hypothetical protein